ncbi:MAG: hypothetical protein JWQ66_1701 [Mucilaginibacter sp.]|nr:hypothetical protein [Mucilaginibacter sp.]
MRRNTLNKLLILCCALAIMGCKARKQAIVATKSAGEPAVVKPVISSKLIAIQKNQTNFTTFSGKAKTKLDINGSSNDVTLNIRIQKGQKIWVSITAIAGIEVARALITPDSLLVINKLQGLYLKKPFSYIYTYTSRQVDYSSLEALLVGNAIPQLLNDDTRMQADSGRTILSGNLQELAYKLILGPDMKASHTELADQAEGQSLMVDNTTFIQAENRVLPSQIDMTSVAKSKKVQVNLHYIKADFDLPLQYPFSIPSSYSGAN